MLMIGDTAEVRGVAAILGTDGHFLTDAWLANRTRDHSGRLFPAGLFIIIPIRTVQVAL